MRLFFFWFQDVSRYGTCLSHLKPPSSSILHPCFNFLRVTCFRHSRPRLGEGRPRSDVTEHRSTRSWLETSGNMYRSARFMRFHEHHWNHRASIYSLFLNHGMKAEWRNKRPQSALSLAERLSTSEHYSFSLQKVTQARRVSEKSQQRKSAS